MLKFQGSGFMRYFIAKGPIRLGNMSIEHCYPIEISRELHI